MGSRLYPTPQLSLQRNSLFVLVARQEGWEPRGIFDSLHISLSAFPLLHRAVVHLLLPLSSIHYPPHHYSHANPLHDYSILPLSTINHTTTVTTWTRCCHHGEIRRNLQCIGRSKVPFNPDRDSAFFVARLLLSCCPNTRLLLSCSLISRLLLSRRPITRLLLSSSLIT